ncbi:MAG TPA: hypothetical protein VKR06_04505, partial [Ktedonosporobacter sp.]|nr:hypothetical protein [Ktedonosporobacter sp.]
PQTKANLSVDHVATQSSAIDIASYERQLNNYYDAHHRHTSYERLPAIREAILLLYQSLPFSYEKRTTQVLSRYHIMIASIMRDQCLFSEAVEHLNRAVHLTKHIDDYEFLADAFYRRGWVYLEQEQGEKAVQSFLSAEKLIKKIPSYMAGGIFIGLGRSLAIEAHDSRTRLEALNTLDKAANTLRICPPPGKNWHYLEIDIDRYHVDKSSALIDIAWPNDALRELSYLRYSSDIKRRNALIYTLHARTYFSLSKYAEACNMAEEALPIVKAIQSVGNYQRIKELHSQLKLTNFGNNPEVARLGVTINKINIRDTAM